MTSTDPGGVPPSGDGSHRRSESAADSTSPTSSADVNVEPGATYATTSTDGTPVVVATGSTEFSGDGSGGEPPDDGDGDHDHDHDDAKQRKSFWRELPVLVLVALVLAFLIKTFLVQAFFIPSESMENTLLVGDRVLVNKLAYRFGEVDRGDVIVFDGKGSFEPRKPADDDGNSFGDALKAIASSFGLAPGTESDYIKRVIGVGGDHVVCCDDEGRITVNDVPLDPEDYLFPGDVPSASPFDIMVPAGRLWVMGDHRSRSEDSRAHTGAPGGGTVSVDRVIGRAFVKVWPISRWDTMPRPPAFDDLPPPAASGD